MGPQFRYTLTYLNEDYQLKYAPDGWDSETLGSISRDKEKFGISRKFSLPMRFVKDGAELLRNAFLAGGYEVGVRLRVERRERLWNYTTVYLGDIDFSQYDYDGIAVSVPVMETGITANIKARESTVYEFPLVGADVVNVILPGVKFNDRLLWSLSQTDTSNLNADKKFQPDIDLITQSKSGYIEGFNQQQRNAANTDDFNSYVFVRNNRNEVIRATLNGYIKGFVQNRNLLGANEAVNMAILTTGDNSAVFIPFFFGGNWGPLEARTFDSPIDNITVDLQPGQGMYIYVRTFSSPSILVTTIQEGEIELSFETISDPSNCKGIRPFDLFRRIMNRVSPGTQLNSALLNNTWKNLIITSGSAIRELEDAKIKISLKDFYQGFRGIDDVGLGSENGIFRMETLPFFFRNITIMDVGNVNRCTTTISEDWIYSKLTVGYENKTTDEPDGREGFNAKQDWQYPVTRINNEHDLVSTFLADQYEIEKLRIMFNVKREATSDSNSDNDTFIVHCNDIDTLGNLRPIVGGELEEVTGLTAVNTSYNLLISPKRNLLRHSRYISSMLDLLGSRYIEFASAEKNANISTTQDGRIVIENKSILVSELGAQLFRPYIFTINAKLPTNAMQLIDANPFAKIAFNFNGTQCSGFILEANVDLAGNAAQEITLLCAPDGLLP